MKIEIKELEKKNFEDGEKFLLENGYVQSDSATDDQSSYCDYIIDTYYTLYSEDGEEVHVVSFVRCYNKNNDPANDDGSADFVVREYWTEV